MTGDQPPTPSRSAPSTRRRTPPLVHAWVDDPRARFWGMVGHTVDQVAEIYAYVDSLPHHHAHLVSSDGRPVALLQTYWPEHDPVGDCYQVQPGDFGLHLLVAPTDTRGRRASAPARCTASGPGPSPTRRATPGRRARPAQRQGDPADRRSGFVLGPEIELPDKRARLAFLERAVFEQSVPCLDWRA